MNFFKSPFFLKLLALVPAVLAYLYFYNVVDKMEKKPSDPSYKLIKLTAKKLPIKPRMAMQPAEGYAVVNDQAVADPSRIIVVGPEALLDEASSAETALVDVSESTKTVTRLIPLESVGGIPLTGDPYLVEVTVPIEKVKQE